MILNISSPQLLCMWSNLEPIFNVVWVDYIQADFWFYVRTHRRSLDSPRSRHDLLLSDEFAVQKLVDQKLLISISVYTLHRNLEFKLRNNKNSVSNQ